ncbi:ArsH family arsenic resistance protein [Hafnia paralvei ATCC 29927]|uniref:arsenical resistance protein ArsH n=1 Tax=Hafnia TaxID=568 RepID=UPI0007E4A89C|nr:MULTISPECIES: arsenical resistance protein ArsH [Hafnia]MDU1190840.1 arsenical resistance protein ArsH [Enterobacteriaceae bacterium]MDU1243638.1 arsenical resistance protein ArsH [Enterobacteriaceae bacterium]OAT41292.1 ArsH family arsenic resistance protein [Hafnia paralvei ATCC 29927]OFS08864.1 arsenical resistance protein ArsH [Hafnia sp. HMSC23F03]HCU15105.1 arsenical resistance protein ArsH [Hafnia paralvei]
MTQLPAVELDCFDDAIVSKLASNTETMPRFLILYGSVRERSYSRFAAEEAGRLLTKMGAEVKTFNPSGLPLPDDALDSHPKVLELRELVRWCDGMIWSSPERHGAMSSVMKAQIDWIPLSEGAVRPSQGKTLAVMQVCGGSQSFNAVNQLRILGRWMRMFTIPNQSSVPKAWQEFDDEGRMKPSPWYDRIVDVAEELFKITLILKEHTSYLADRYSERKENHQELSARVNQAKI